MTHAFGKCLLNNQELISLFRWVIEECKRQQSAEEQEQLAMDTRGHLMGQVEQIEIELNESLEQRQMTMVNIV